MTKLSNFIKELDKINYFKENKILYKQLINFFLKDRKT